MKKALYTLIFISLTVSFQSCKDKAKANKTASTPVAVSSYTVKAEKMNFYTSYPANIVALKEVELRGNVSGYVTGIFFTEGSQVKKGQKLYEIDRRKYLAAYDEANANVEIAQSNLDKVQLDADRYTELDKQDAVAKQLVDHALTEVANAKQELILAKAELEKALTDYEYSQITAPFDGTIGISQVKTGTLISPGVTLLNTISTDDPTGVDFVISEKELGRFMAIEKKVTDEKDSTFKIYLPDDSIYPYNCKISLIDRAVDPQTGTITVRLVVANPDRKLLPGMSCNVKVLNENPGMQVVIPFKAVVEQMGEYFVYKIDSSKAKQVKVSIGTISGSNVIIKSGLNAGTSIVADGLQKLHDGSIIKVENK